ncbi:MOZ/SAS family protein [Anopheles sinensis]|uniref:MOZ/SAS family protein n=1 Tax=Anopheles sinensis TaxID=74873 RepID=A0A084WRG4_ANOSI|nr:MOZ/SAS family protein [Anopheles sinensis]
MVVVVDRVYRLRRLSIQTAAAARSRSDGDAMHTPPHDNQRPTAGLTYSFVARTVAQILYSARTMWTCSRTSLAIQLHLG